MKKLVKSATLLASVGAMLCFAGCNSVGDKPEEVVLDLLKKAQSGKIDQEFLSKYCEEDTAKLFSGHQMTDALKGAKFTVDNVFVDDDIAVVKIWQDGGERSAFLYYDAKKVDGHWRIQLNTKGGTDDLPISQKTISECVETFKAAICGKAMEPKYFARCTSEIIWVTLRGTAAELPLEKFEEMKKALSRLKIKEYKRFLSDVIWVELEMPWKDGSMKRGRLTIRLDIREKQGAWRIDEFSDLNNFLGIE